MVEEKKEWRRERVGQQLMPQRGGDVVGDPTHLIDKKTAAASAAADFLVGAMTLISVGGLNGNITERDLREQRGEPAG